MKEISLKDIIKWTRGEAHVSDANMEIGNITTDSKDVKTNSLFVPRKGEFHDGHDFIPDFFKRGGKVSLTDHFISDYDIIVVKDTMQALRDIAKCHRDKFVLPIIGITGSVGKTSTRGMISSVLATSGEVCETEKNLNTEVGVPLTLMNIEKKHKAAVVEMGMRNLGEISYLTNIVKPDIAVITNIGTAHIENLKNRENILKAKMEILEGLPKNGLVILNGDDDLLWTKRRRCFIS